MLNTIKTLLIGIPFITQVALTGGTAAALTGTAVAYKQTQACHGQPVVTTYYDDRIAISASVVTHEDGSLTKGTEKTVSAGVQGLDVIKHTVTKHCGKFIDDIASPPVSAKVAVAEVKNIGTAYDGTEDQPISYGTQLAPDASQLRGTSGVKTAGTNGVKRVTYHYSHNEGQEVAKTYVSETVVTTPLDEIDWYGTKAPAPLYPTKLSRTGICHAPGSTYYNQTLYYTAFNTLGECLNAGGRLPLR